MSTSFLIYFFLKIIQEGYFVVYLEMFLVAL